MMKRFRVAELRRMKWAHKLYVPKRNRISRFQPTEKMQKYSTFFQANEFEPKDFTENQESVGHNVSVTQRHTITMEDQEFFIKSLDLQILEQMMQKNYNYTMNFNKLPVIGSIVQLHGVDELGVVVGVQKHVFSLNTQYKLCTEEGEILHFRPCDVSFHIRGLFDASKIHFEDVYTSEDLKKIQTLARVYREGSTNLLETLSRHGFNEILFGKIAKQSNVTTTDINDILQNIPIFNKNMMFFGNTRSWLQRNKLNNLFIFYAVFLQVGRLPEYFLRMNVHDYATKSMNGGELYLLNSAPLVVYVNSVYNSFLLRNALSDNDDAKLFINKISEFCNGQEYNHSSTFAAYIADPKSCYHSDRVLFETYILLLKTYIIYPHEKFQKKLETLFGELATGWIQSFFVASGVSRSTVYDFLIKLKVYDSKTNIYGILMQQSSDLLDYAEENAFKKDIFAHLRADRETVSFAISSTLAISIDKLDSKSTQVNIHIPDLGSHVNPRSSLFFYLLNKGTRIANSDENSDAGFVPEFVHEACSFTGNNKHCITFSFIYNPWTNVPFDIDDLKFDIKLESLKQIKVLSDVQVKEVIENKLRFLHIFYSGGSRGASGDSSGSLLYKREKEDVSQIYGICQRINYLRNDNYALESEFDGLSDSLSFFKRELMIMVGHISCKYATKNGLPIYHYSQGVNNHGDESDNREISPSNYLLPVFKAFEYEHFTFDKNEGKVVPTAFVGGMNFLEEPIVHFETHEPKHSELVEIESGNYKKRSEFNENSHRKLGLKNGYVNFRDIFGSVEQLINQWQLILSLNTKFLSNSDYELRLEIMRRLSAQNFNIEKFETSWLKKIYFTYIKPSLRMQDFLEYQTKRYHTLKQLKSQISEFGNNNIFKCVVTQSGKHPDFAWGYCVDLGLFVEISSFENTQLIVGDQVICNNVLFLDEFSGRLVLQI